MVLMQGCLASEGVLEQREHLDILLIQQCDKASKFQRISEQNLNRGKGDRTQGMCWNQSWANKTQKVMDMLDPGSRDWSGRS
jgi:hypothetical protein